MPKLLDRLTELRREAIREATKLAKQGEAIVLDPGAEDALYELLEAQRELEEIVKDAKRRIEEAALAYNPNFKAIVGTKLRIGYRFFGDKYRVDSSQLAELPPNFYRASTRYHAVTTAVDEYLESEKKLPLGIRPVDRAKQLTIKPVEEEVGDE